MALEHELFILWLLATEGEVGRYRLARMIGKSEGVARGILSSMKRKGLIKVTSRVGPTLCRKGSRRLDVLMKQNRLRSVQRSERTFLGLGLESVVFQAGGGSRSLGQGIEQRDAAIKAGASGAVTFTFDGKILKYAGVSESVSKRSPATVDQLERQLRMRKGDVILIAFGDSWWNAARGGFAAIRTLAYRQLRRSRS